MNGKYTLKILGAFLLALIGSGIASKAQLLPPDPFYELDSWGFEDTNFLSDLSDAPISMENLGNPASFDGSAVQVDSTNAAWLQYSITNSAVTNLTFLEGAIELAALLLKAYTDDLHNRLPGYAIDFAAHSLGNVVANEAIREGAVVDNYALMQAAISAEAFDGTNSGLTYDYLAPTATNSPAANVLGGYNNCAINATRRVNFYNDDDWALFEGVLFGVTTHTWEGNQLDKPQQNIVFGIVSVTYSFDGTNCFYTQNNNLNGTIITNRTIAEDFEKKSFVARSRTKAVGCAGLKYDPFTLTGGSISTNISLQNAALGFSGGAQFGTTRPDHSGEFQKAVQNTIPFYFQLLQQGFQVQPQLSP